MVFVSGAYPGDRLRARVVRKKGGVRFAEIDELLASGIPRVDPPCPHFGLCGGCDCQDIAHDDQIGWKRDVFRDVLRRLGGIEAEPGESLVDRAYGYRYRVSFKISRNGEPGFFQRRSKKVVPVSECRVLAEHLAGVVGRLREVDWRKIGIREVRLAANDHGEVVARSKGGGSAEDTGAVWDKLEDVLIGLKGEKETFGKPRLVLDLSGLACHVNADTFFQAHWTLNRRLAELVAEWVKSAESIVDLYGGSGNLSLLPAARADVPVRIFEGSRAAVRLGKKNARVNGLGGVEFIHSDLLRGQPDIGANDTVIVDPPRAGLSRPVVTALMAHRPRRLVYVSCDPATLARDLKTLVEHYEITDLRLVDFFPQTYHIEAAVRLEAR